MHPGGQQTLESLAEIVKKGRIFLEFRGCFVFLGVDLELELRAQSAKTGLEGIQEHTQQVIGGLGRVLVPGSEFVDEPVPLHGVQNDAHQRHQQFLFVVILPGIEPDRLAGPKILFLFVCKTVGFLSTLAFREIQHVLHAQQQRGLP